MIHSSSLRQEIATGHSAFTVISTGSTSHPLPYQINEGATVCLRGLLQSGSIRQECRRLFVIHVNIVRARGSKLLHYFPGNVFKLHTSFSVLKGDINKGILVCTIICVSVTLEGNAHAQNGDDCGGMYSDPLLFRHFAYLTTCISVLHMCNLPLMYLAHKLSCTLCERRVERPQALD